jgi:hypothetical protein
MSRMGRETGISRVGHFEERKREELEGDDAKVSRTEA